MNVGTEDVDPCGEEGAANADDQSGVIPAAEEDFTVSLLGMVHPFDHGANAAGSFFALGSEKLAEETDVSGNFRGGESAEITLRHVGKVRGGFAAVVGRQLAEDFVLQLFEIDAAFFEKSRAILEVSFGRAVKVPDEALFPIRPTGVTRALSVGQGDEHERVEVVNRLHQFREMRDGGGVIEVAGLCGFGKEAVVVDQHDERAALLGGQLQAFGHAGGHHGAGFFMVAAVFGLARVVHQEREVKRGRIVVFEEQIAVAGEFRILAGDQVVQFVDADQSVLVGRVTVEKFMLHQAGETSELGQIASEKISLVHETQDASDLTLAGEDGKEHLARGARVLEGAVDQTESFAHQAEHFLREVESAHLSVLEETHQSLRILGENTGRVGVEHAVLGVKAVEAFRPFGRWRKETEQTGGAGGLQLGHHAVHGGGCDAVDVARVLVIVAHEGLHAGQHVLLWIFQPRGDLPLEVKGERIDRALVDEMHLGADAEQEVVGLFEEPAFAFGQDFFLHQFGRRHGVRMEVSVPEEILVIAQAAGPVFHVGFLHGHDASVLLVQFLLVDQSPGDVGVLLALDAFAFEFPAEAVDKFAVPGQPARFEHGGLGLQIGVGLRNRFTHGAHGVPYLETGIPEQAEDFLHGGGFPRVRFVPGVEEHDVDIAERIHLPASVSAEGDDGQTFGLRFSEMRGADLRENAAEENVDQVAALPHDFAAAGPGRNAQAQAVLFQPAETPVRLEAFGGGFSPGLLVEILGGADEDFFGIVTHEPQGPFFSGLRPHGE